MNNDFAIDLKAARRKAGLTQSDCAHLMGRSASKVCQLERGQRTPGLKEICTLSFIYGRSFESLFGVIFEDVRADLAENLATLPDGKDNWAGKLNRSNTLNRLADSLSENTRHNAG